MLKLPGPNAFIPDDFSLVCDRNDFKQGGVDDSVQGMNEVATHGDGEDTEAFKARGQGSADGENVANLQRACSLKSIVFMDTAVYTYLSYMALDRIHELFA